jgi:hypothetical protein
MQVADADYVITPALLKHLRTIMENYVESIKSPVTKKNVPAYINAYCRHWFYYQSDYDGKLLYRYDKLFEAGVEGIQERAKHFVICKKKAGFSASNINGYINYLVKFYKTNGIRGIDWDLVREYAPEPVKKTKDREYYADEVFAIEGKLDDRGKAVSGLIRGSGVRRGGEPGLSVGDLFPRSTKYGKIYKMWVYRGTPEEYVTACIPETAARLDTYFEYRMRYGEMCPHFGKDHSHELHDGEDAVLIHYTADQRHLDPEAPVIRDAFNKRVVASAMRPKRLDFKTISDIIYEAAKACGVRVVNKDGDTHKHHKVMITHGLRKLFKKRMRQAKVDPIILERFMGHRSGNPKDGITKLMMVYDPEEWEEMEQEFIKAVPHLTLSKDALLQAELEEQRSKTRALEEEQVRVKEFEERLLRQKEESDRRYEYVISLIQQNPKLAHIRPEALIERANSSP